VGAMKNDLILLYKNKILAVRNYKSEKHEFSTEDFIKLQTLASILDEVATGESDITPAGKSFIAQYYGFHNLADLLISENTLTESIADLSSDKLRLWLENLKPMEIIRFVMESKGVIHEGQPLNEKLLPPTGDEELNGYGA
jgi:hypothetical protein